MEYVPIPKGDIVDETQNTGTFIGRKKQAWRRGSVMKQVLRMTVYVYHGNPWENEKKVLFCFLRFFSVGVFTKMRGLSREEEKLFSMKIFSASIFQFLPRKVRPLKQARYECKHNRKLETIWLYLSKWSLWKNVSLCGYFLIAIL